MTTNPDELRRLSQQSLQSKRQQEERVAQEARQSAADKKQDVWEEQWSWARQAVADLDENITEAASEGRFETVVYEAGQNEVFKIKTHFHRPWYAVFDASEYTCKYEYTIPAYAQYVFDSCSQRRLNPRWELHSGRRGISGPADGRSGFSSTSAEASKSQKQYLHVLNSDVHLELIVRW